MADITITCGHCGNRITVSEYVDADSLVCVKCRQTVSVPRRIQESPMAAMLKLASPPPPSPSQTAPSAAASARQAAPARKRLRRRNSVGIQPAAWGYVTFVFLAVALLYLRFYPNAMPDERHKLLITAAIAALGFLHLSVIAYAFADDAFHGVLCAVIPGYSIYYLYTEADQFLLRAVVAALLLAFGRDTVQFVSCFSSNVYVHVMSWIRDTDILKKDGYQQIK